MMRLSLSMLLLAGAAALLPAATAAHEVPARVHVTGLIRPDGDRLRVLMRVPLNAMRDMEFPLYGAGLLDIANAGPVLTDAALLWVAGSMRVYENGEPLAGVRVAAVRVSLPSDLSFATWSEALAHTTSAADPRVQLPWEQAMLDVLLEYPIVSANSRFAVNPMFAHLGMRTTTELRFLTSAGEVRTYTFASNPGMVRLNPAWHHVAMRFLRGGAASVGGSVQLLLLILCTIAGFRRTDEAGGIYLPFAVGVMLPIAAGASDMMPNLLWVVPAIDLLIALAILCLALDTIVGTNFGRRARAAFAGGAIAGASLWYTLEGSLQFAAGQDLIAVLLYSLGAQAAVLALAAGAAALLTGVLPRFAANRIRRAERIGSAKPIDLANRAGTSERVGTIVLCAMLAHTAWHWALDRGAALRAYDISLQVSSYGWLQIVRGVMLIALFALVAGAGYIASRRLAPVRVRAGTSGSGVE